MEMNCLKIFSNVFAGLLASCAFILLTGIFNRIKWWCKARKFVGEWEYRDVIAETGEIKVLNDGHERTITINRYWLNPRILITHSKTYESNTPRSWEGRYEIITSNFVTGRYQYNPDEFKPQFGYHEFRTQKNNGWNLLLVAVFDGGMRDFDKSGQCFEKIKAGKFSIYKMLQKVWLMKN